MDTLPPVRSRADVPSSLPDGDGAAFGLFLRRARERRGLSLKQIADETRIPERHLHALEQGNLSAVPRGIYQRAEIRAYAKAVGLDQSVALTQFERALQSLEPLNRSALDREARPQALAMIGIVSLTIAAISIVAMRTQSGERQTNAQPIQAEPAATSEAAREAAQTAPAPARKSDTTSTADIKTPPGQNSIAVGEKAPRSATKTPSNPLTPSAPKATTRPPAARATATNATARADVKNAAQVSPAMVVQLVITSEPAGAHVTVDGVGWGVTPVTISHLPPGNKVIRLTMEGHSSAERRVSIADGPRQPRKIHIPLRVQR